MLPLPASMALQSQRALERFSPPLTEADQQLRAVLGFSDFVAESLQQNPQWVRSLREHPPQAEEEHNYAQWLADVMAGAGQEADIRQCLRQFRRHMLVRIAWLQILYQATTRQTLRQLSTLAEVLIVAARDWCWQQCCQELGTPTDSQGGAQPLLILGMGKLGGRELNFSSDIDLIFAWPENGTTYGGRRELDNAQFFTRMGQRLIKLLDQPDSNGFVYRVDMRLRPFGDSGPLVMSFSALEDYYQQHGRDWERYAMVKGRVMGADSHLSFSHQLHQMLRPFIYRRYIDFSVIPSLRSMKAKITHEVRRRGLIDNIKLSAGGIRECEFIVQVFQLIRGGRERALQQQSLLYALDEVANLGLLEPQYAETLRSAYLYLRRLENLLQSINDQQTQTLPEDPLNQQRLAWAMGENDWRSLRQRTDQHMQSVRKIFDELIGEQDPQPTVTRHQAWQQVWSEQAEAEDLAEVTPGLPEPIQHRLVRDIREFHREFNQRALGPRGRQALDRLMPDLLAGACLYNNADQVLQRLCPVLSSVFTRSTYLELLTEYPQALKQLIRLCAASSMVATRLARYPMLLDELLDPATLYQPTALNNYRDELRQYLLRVPAEDEEQQLEALRQFKLTQQLRIAAADIAGTLPLMKVSDHLTWLAEAILEAVVQQAWAQVIQRFGQPDHLRNETCQGFAVVAYGKLGGWELGYGSDLDLIFLHDCPAQAMTTGERMIDGRQFYLKLAQRILHLFSTRTASGILYEVDARLRPSGSSGMLVSTFSAFEQYQREEAWTWEHQALVRARIVYASPPLQQQFEQIRQRILCLPRHPQQLQTDVREMRKKMLKQLGNRHLPDWDIKADSGGITDIEFIAQYLVLRFAATQPALTRWTGNIRIFELLARYQIMSATQAGALSQAYIRLRDQFHHLALQEASRGVAQDQFSGERALILSSWQQWLLDPATAVD